MLFAYLGEHDDNILTGTLKTIIDIRLDDIDEEIAEIQEEIDIIDDEARSNAPAPANAKLVNGRTVGSFQGAEVRENPLSTMEYRQAFMNYAINGTPIPAELRGEAINTADTGVAIPMTIMNEVINTVRKSPQPGQRSAGRATLHPQAEHS